MRLIPKLVLAGTATLIAGAAIAAAAAPTKTKDVVLPNGMVAHIRYTGDVAPDLVLTPVATVAPIAMLDPFGAGSPFADFDRIAAAMDAQADAMMRQVSALAAQGTAQGTPHRVAAGDLPAGSVVRYSFVSSSNGGATCSRSMQVVSAGDGAQPQVKSSQSGACSNMGLATPRSVSAPAAPAAPAAPLPVSAPKPPLPPVPANTI